MTFPVFGLTYCASGILSVLGGLLSRNERSLIKLGVVILVFSVFDAYVEEWRSSYANTFMSLSILLLLAFFLAYTEWSVALMRHVVPARRGHLYLIAFLPIVWMLSGSMLLLLPRFQKWENPPMAVYAFLVFICVLHVPAFAAGKDKTLKTADKQFLLSPSDFPPLLLPGAIAALLTPTLVTLCVQIAARDDWRLFSLNAILVGANLALTMIARPRKPDAVRSS